MTFQAERQVDFFYFLLSTYIFKFNYRLSHTWNNLYKFQMHQM